jgi:hypothetical protein
MSIRGSLDVITPTGVTGWAYAPEERFVTVQALLGHQVIGEAVANLHRADLAGAGIGDGNCGYSITFYEKLDPLTLPFVSVKPEGGDVELPRVTVAGFGDFFGAVHRKRPPSQRPWRVVDRPGGRGGLAARQARHRCDQRGHDGRAG